MQQSSFQFCHVPHKVIVEQREESIHRQVYFVFAPKDKEDNRIA
jgi:hypothetical protein